MAAETGRAVRRGTNLDRVGEFNDTVVLAAIRRAEERLSLSARMSVRSARPAWSSTTHSRPTRPCCCPDLLC